MTPLDELAEALAQQLAGRATVALRRERELHCTVPGADVPALAR